MGLDIVCGGEDCPVQLFKGGYSTFFDFRRAIATALGHGYTEEEYITSGDAVLARIKRAKPLLFAFLAHSDCEGEWTPRECVELLPLFDEAIPRLAPEDGPVTRTWIKSEDGCLSCTTRPSGRTWIEFAKTLRDGLWHCGAHNHAALFR